MKVENILNLTRKKLPKISSISKTNIESINNMPEFVLHKMIQKGNNSILHIDMNQCGAATIKKGGITTIYTDALNGCNSVGAVLKLINGDKLCILSHYVPTNTQGQINAFKKQLTTYANHIDKTYKPKLFFNIRGYVENGKLQAVCNPIVEGIKKVFKENFKTFESFITPYQNKNRPAFFSSANIFQFNPKNTNELKITNVGEKEMFIDLTV